MSERWRSKTARKLAKDVRAAGGNVERVGTGKLKITGPAGSVTIHEPGSETRPDLARASASKLIKEQTGLDLSDGS